MGSEERLAGERSERMSVGERREPLDVVTELEMNLQELQRKEGLQVFQEMNRKEERPGEYPLMHTAATRGVL